MKLTYFPDTDTLYMDIAPAAIGGLKHTGISVFGLRKTGNSPAFPK